MFMRRTTALSTVLLSSLVIGLSLGAVRFGFLADRGARLLRHLQVQSPELAGLMTPWQSVGGCGASSGSSADMQLKWIGKGVSGGYIDAEAVYIHAIVADTAYLSPNRFDGHLKVISDAVLLSLFYHPSILDFKLSMPVVIKQGYGTTTGLLGDLGLDITKRWGSEGNIRTALTFGAPTGNSSILTDESTCQPAMQLGGGTYNGGFRADYTMDQDWGLIAFGTSYTGGFFDMKTKTWKYDADLNRSIPDKKTFATARYFTHTASGKLNGWGSINDVGTVQPDIASAFVDFGIKTPSFVHGISFSYTLPTCKGAYEDRKMTTTNWSATDNSDPTLYFPTREQAQAHADAISDPGLSYYHSLVLAPNRSGQWTVMMPEKLMRGTFPGLTMQYCLEKSDANLPLLFGATSRLDYNKGFVFSSFGVGAGIKFAVY